MNLKFILIAVLAVAFLALLPQNAQAQFISEVDTFKILDVTAKPGDTVAVKLYVANDSISLAAMAFYVKIDTSVIEFVGVVDSFTVPPITYINFDLIGRALGHTPPLFNQIPAVAVVNESPFDSLFLAFFGAGDSSQIPTGSGNMLQFYVRIKEDVPLLTQTLLRIFSPEDEGWPVVGGTGPELRRIEFCDSTGERCERFPTLVPGILTVDTVTIVPPDNNAPVINQLAQTSYVIEPGQSVGFNVTAYDPDAGDFITLTATGLPTRATFGTGGSVSGTSSVGGTFSWAAGAGDIGTHVVTFTCVDDEGAFAVPRSVTIVVQTVAPPPGDLLYTTSSDTYGKPSGGIPGFSGSAIPVNLNETVPVYGVQFDFFYNASVIEIDSIVPTERLEGFTVYDDLGQTAGKIRIVAFGLNNETVQPGSSGEIVNFWASVKPGAAVGQYPISFADAWEAISPNPNVPSVELNFDTTGMFQVDTQGDVNGDRRVDVADMVIVVGYIIGDYALDTRQFAAADMDANTSVDVIDLQTIINIVFGGVPPLSPSYWDGPLAQLMLGTDDYLIDNNDVIEINADLPTEISGVQLEIIYDPEKIDLAAPERTSLSSGLELKYRDNGHGRMIVLLYTIDSRTAIGASVGSVLKLPVSTFGDISREDGAIRITQAILSDPSATEIPVEGFNRVVVPDQFTLDQNYPNPFNPETNISFSITPQLAFRDVRLEIFNILGEKVKTLLDEPLDAGDYTVRWDGTNSYGSSVASGVYLYRLEVGDFSDTKKMVLMK